MRREDIKVGSLYALRVNAVDELLKVKALRPPKRGQVKVEHLSGDDTGLQEWVKTRHLMCPWTQRKAFLRDEEQWALLRQVSREARDFVVEDAISSVLTATGEETGFQLVWRSDPAKVRRLWARAGLTDDPTHERYAFVDREGMLCLPYPAALRFAQAFAAVEPETCLLYVREWEERLRAEGYQPGHAYAHSALREFAPGFALIKDWASKPLAEYLEKELGRVRGIAEQAIEALRASGKARQASALSRQLDGG